MGLPRLALAAGLAALVPGPGSLAAQGLVTASALEARVWLDRGTEPLLRTGDQVRVYYRTNYDAYVSIFHIDTDGTTRLVFPHAPDEDHYVRGGRDYRLLFPRSPFWFVEDQPGVGYFFAIASPEPFDFSRFRFSRYDLGWDLSLVGRQVYHDPYVAMDDYVAALLPDWDRVPYALDFASYDVGERHEYPRFLCYDCHGFRSYAAWNPYHATCTDFRVVIYDDPYFYPARRYRGDRVVWARPAASERPRFAFKARVGGEPDGPLLRARAATDPTPAGAGPVPRRSPGDGAGGVAPSTRTTPDRIPVIRGRAVPSSSPPAATDVERPGLRPSVRPGGAVAPSTRSQPTEVPQQAPAAGADDAPDQRLRPVLRKRPSDGAAAPAPAPARGSSSPPVVTPPSRGGGASTSPPRSARPRVEEPAPAAERPSGSSSPAPARTRDGGEERPTVRSTPDGRPVIRRGGGD